MGFCHVLLIVLFGFLLLTLFTSLPQAIRNYVVCLHYRWLLYYPRLIDLVTEEGHADSTTYAQGNNPLDWWQD